MINKKKNYKKNKKFTLKIKKKKHLTNNKQIHKKNKIIQKKKKYNKSQQNNTTITPTNINFNKTIIIKKTNSLNYLSQAMSVKKQYLINILKNIDKNININLDIDENITTIIAKKIGFNIKLISSQEKNNYDKEVIHKPIIKLRPPIVTLIGHVNHGKTSLLEHILNINLTKKETGYITQYINAYFIKTKYGKITFLDTPGHEAFIKMRDQGINITDIIILIISIDDGIMPQTIEILKNIQKHNIPIIITLTKIDKLEYQNNIKLIKKKLLQYNMIPLQWGGNTIYNLVSVKTKKGINTLLKSIIKKSKQINLTTNINQLATGIIIESSITKQEGPIAHILVTNGTLKIGDIIICHNTYGKIKKIYNNKKSIKSITAAIPVKIIGLQNTPDIGKKFYTLNNIKKAKKIIKHKLYLNNIKKNNISYIQNTHELNNCIITNKNNNIKINIIVKTDVLGTINAIKQIILLTKKISQIINIIYINIGPINKYDISLAQHTKSIIFIFNIQNTHNIINIMKQLNIQWYYFNIIYEMINKLIKISDKKIAYHLMYNVPGQALVKNIFQSINSGIIAGCIITQGSIQIHNTINIIRNKKIIHTGIIKSLKKFKQDINIIHKGSECGINIKNYNHIKIGDIIEVNIK